VFWAWVLSRRVVNVLPTEEERPTQVRTAEPVTEW